MYPNGVHQLSTSSDRDGGREKKGEVGVGAQGQIGGNGGFSGREVRK